MRFGLEKPAVRVHEKGWHRKPLALWDGRWHALAPEARALFLDAIDPRSPKTGLRFDAQTAATRASALGPLEQHGFIVVTRKGGADLRVAPSPRAREFTLRMRAIGQAQLLSSPKPTGLVPYVRTAYFLHEGAAWLARAVPRARIAPDASMDQIAERWVTRGGWPEWAAPAVKSPLKHRVLDVIRAADGPLPQGAVAARLPDARREDVRDALDELIAHLVLFEDLHPETHEIVVDFLPVVRAALAQAGQPRERPPLVVCERPEEIAFDGGFVVNDLRAFLLEVASEPPRLKQFGGLFAKELPRFREALEPPPRWLADSWRVETDSRVHGAAGLARRLGLVHESAEPRLRLTAAGQKWLGGGPEAQYVSVFKSFHERSERGMPSYYLNAHSDSAFLAVPIVAVPASRIRKEAHRYGRVEINETDILKLRDALLGAFEALPMGAFCGLDSVLDHLSFDAASPFNLGRPPGETGIVWGEMLVPDFPEDREQVARRALEWFISGRLVPAGALRLGWASGVGLCVARTPLLAALFGRPGLKLDGAAAAAGGTRVVVQPDFSVIVIGLDPVPAAALAPFCERSGRQANSGALVLKLTRESVVKAISLGMAADEIVDRLRQHASNGLPANVEREVREWGGWVRSVEAAPMTVLRCGDGATADRVAAALGKRAERLGDTLVALAADRLAPAERAKLRSQGILVSGGEATRRKTRKRRRRGYDDDW